jgi:hypothetical protein
MTSEAQQAWRLSRALNVKWTGRRDASGRRINAPAPSITLELEIGDAPWKAIYSLTAVGGRAVLSDVKVVRSDPSTPPMSLPARLARELLRPAQAVKFARELLAEDNAEVLALWHLDAAQFGVVEVRGKRRPDYFYAAIAAHYIEVYESGSTEARAETATRLPGYEPRFVRDALDKARKRELLDRPKGGQRHAGGELTARGLQVLQEGPPDGYAGPSPPGARP